VNPARGALPLTSSDRIAEAIKYIFDQAKALKKAAVVNVSLGHNGAGHDGECVVERAIDRLLESEGRALVKSAGNEGAWQTHASGRIAVGETFDLEWIAGGGVQAPASPLHRDRTANTLEVWYSSRDRFRVRLSDPSLAVTGNIDPGQQLSTTLSNHPVYIESERFHPLTGKARILVRVGIDPTTGFVASWTWRVSLVGLEAIDEEFDAWIERDARDASRNFADQSYFLNPNPEKTISPPGTIRRGVAVGNYDHRSTPPKLAASSSRGPTADGRPKPEVSAPGVKISSSNAGGAASGRARILMTGTSMSAPHVTGVVAQLFQRNKTLTAAQIRAILIASARRPGVAQGSPFDPLWGYGAADAEEAVRLIS
jgi:subtilisin family serine protease